MKKLQESPLETISVNNNDFEGFGGDEYYDEDYTSESKLERVDTQVLDTAKIDELISAEDYMGYQEYLDSLDEDQRLQAQEYVENNYPEFLQDEEGSTFEPMKGNTNTDKALIDNFEKKTSFDKRDIKDELGNALLESYANAA